ncbi:hypothetical protein RQP46_005068 [Phenoliferia psychrophenolica]
MGKGYKSGHTQTYKSKSTKPGRAPPSPSPSPEPEFHPSPATVTPPSSPSSSTPEPVLTLLSLPLELLTLVAEMLEGGDLAAGALICSALSGIFATELHRVIVHKAYGVDFRGDVQSRFVASREARIAGAGQAYRTEHQTLAFRGDVDIDDDLFLTIGRAEDLKSLKVNMINLKTEQYESPEDYPETAGFFVGGFWLTPLDTFKNLVCLTLLPGYFCTMLDLPFVVPNAFPNLNDVTLGEMAKMPSNGLYNLLKSIFSGLQDNDARSLELTLIFSDDNWDCPMVHTLKGSSPPPRPPPARAATRALAFDDFLPLWCLKNVLASPPPNLDTLVHSPIGWRAKSPGSIESLGMIGMALRGRISYGPLSQLKTLAFRQGGEIMRGECTPGWEALKPICEKEGVFVPIGHDIQRLGWPLR